MWGKSQSSFGTGGYFRYATSTCLNHLRSCHLVSSGVREQAKTEAAGSPKKRYESTMPYPPTAPIPVLLLSGSRSSLMLPPQSLPPSRSNSPALHLQMLPSPLPFPLGSVTPSPQLPALPFPLINTLPLSGSNPSPYQSPALSLPCTEPSTPIIQSLGWGGWSLELQEQFEVAIARLTAAAGLPLSWVDNPEWVDFVRQFLPQAKSPSRKVLTTRLIPRAIEEYRNITKESTKDQNATIQADGWTGVNFHHLLAFMIAVNKKVRYSVRCRVTDNLH